MPYVTKLKAEILNRSSDLSETLRNPKQRVQMETLALEVVELITKKRPEYKTSKCTT